MHLKEGDRYLVKLNDHESIVSLDDDELREKQIEGSEVMICALIRQTERLSMTPSKNSKQPHGRLSSAKKQ